MKSCNAFVPVFDQHTFCAMCAASRPLGSGPPITDGVSCCEAAVTIVLFTQRSRNNAVKKVRHYASFAFFYMKLNNTGIMHQRPILPAPLFYTDVDLALLLPLLTQACKHLDI